MSNEFRPEDPVHQYWAVLVVLFVILGIVVAVGIGPAVFCGLLCPFIF